jgi:hypothetical protein
LGILYGAYRQGALTNFVASRKLAEEKQHYKELVEEALIAYEADQNRKEAEAAAKDGSPFSFRKSEERLIHASHDGF